MDANQFGKLIETFQAGLNQIIKNIPAAQIQSVDISTITPSFECYNPKIEGFKNYLSRFQNYLKTRNVTDESKNAALLNDSVGAEHYNSLTALLGPSRPITELSYNDLQEAYKQMLTPKRSATVCRHLFMNTYQSDQQNIAQYAGTLQKNLDECDFVVKCECKREVSCADIFLQTQFCRGIRYEHLRGQILQESFHVFSKVVQNATSIEANRIDTKMLAQKEVTAKSPDSNTEAHTTDINRVSQRKNYRKSQKSNNKSKGNRNNTTKNKSCSRFREFGIDGLCLNCGKGNHDS